MRILFVCKYNRFRSQVAEQLFKKYNKNKNLKINSAGIFKGRYPLNTVLTKLVKKFGINVNKRPECLTEEDQKKPDLIIIIAKEIPRSLFKYEGRYIQKIETWNMEDEFLDNKNKIEGIIKSIKLKVKKLVKKLENEK
jgi:protein-tyrosine-phosphatase